MEFVSLMNLLGQTDGFGCGFFVFGCFSQLFNLVFLCLLLVLGLKFLHFNGPSLFLKSLEKMYRHSLKFECCDREEKDNSNNGFVSKSYLVDELDQKKPIILHWRSDSATGLSCEKCDLLLRDGLDLRKNRDCPVALSVTELDESEEEETESRNDEDKVLDLITLRKMVKEERKRGDCVKMELEKERRAAESAAEEAMAMLLKLRMEISSVEMEAKQYRRVAEQKQVYDQQVIQSLQWMLTKLDDDQDNIDIETNS